MQSHLLFITQFIISYRTNYKDTKFSFVAIYMSYTPMSLLKYLLNVLFYFLFFSFGVLLLLFFIVSLLILIFYLTTASEIEKLKTCMTI